MYALTLKESGVLKTTAVKSIQSVQRVVTAVIVQAVQLVLSTEATVHGTGRPTLPRDSQRGRK